GGGRIRGSKVTGHESRARGEPVGEDGRGEFVGRDGELAVAGEAVTAARAGQPRIVVVEGEPGIGKTAVLRRCARIARDAPVVWASGDPAEKGLDGGLVRQLLAALPNQTGAS